MTAIGPVDPDPVATLAECRSRILEREGIPMIVALYDARRGAPGEPVAATESAVAEDGRALAERYESYAVILGGGADSTEGPLTGAATIDTLVVLAERHLRLRVLPG